MKTPTLLMKSHLFTHALLCFGFYSLFATVAQADPVTLEAITIANKVIATKDEQRTKPQTTSFLFARSTNYHATESSSDADTKKGKTSSLVKIQTAKNFGFGTVAVNPALIPYGSIVIAPNKQMYIALDTGTDVITRKASKELAEKKNLPDKSVQSRAPVLDFYSTNQVGSYWDTFLVVRYTGPSFKRLNAAEKILYLKTLSKTIFKQGIT